MATGPPPTFASGVTSSRSGSSVPSGLPREPKTPPPGVVAGPVGPVVRAALHFRSHCRPLLSALCGFRHVHGGGVAARAAPDASSGRLPGGRHVATRAARLAQRQLALHRRCGSGTWASIRRRSTASTLSAFPCGLPRRTDAGLHARGTDTPESRVCRERRPGRLDRRPFGGTAFHRSVQVRAARRWEPVKACRPPRHRTRSARTNDRRSRAQCSRAMRQDRCGWTASAAG